MQKLFFSLQTDLKKRKDPSAFTLLELLIGMTIFAVIAASVYASMYLGVKLYRYDEKNHDAMLEAEAVIDEMSAELSCAFMNEDNKRLKFKGSEESVDFFSVGRKGDIRRVVYYLEPQESPGKEERLVKLIQKYSALDKEEAPKTEILSRKISALKFAYFNPQENSWQAQWSKDSVLPVLVKIDLSIGPGGKGAENVGLEKYVDIMSAQQIDSVKNDQF